MTIEKRHPMWERPYDQRAQVGRIVKYGQRPWSEFPAHRSQHAYYTIDSYSPIDFCPRALIDLGEYPPEKWQKGTWIEEDDGGYVTRVAWKVKGTLEIRDDGPDYYVVLGGLTRATFDCTTFGGRIKRWWYNLRRSV